MLVMYWNMLIWLDINAHSLLHWALMTHKAPANSVVIASSDGYTSHLFSIERSLEPMLYCFLVRDGNELQWNLKKK